MKCSVSKGKRLQNQRNKAKSNEIRSGKKEVMKKIRNKQNIWKEIRFDAFTRILVSLSIVRKKK